VPPFWRRYDDGLAIPQQEKHIPLPQAEGSISRSMTARFNDSANGSAKQQGEATQRYCVVIQTMVPVCRNSLMDHAHNRA